MLYKTAYKSTRKHEKYSMRLRHNNYSMSLETYFCEVMILWALQAFLFNLIH